ncbi:MAG: hypothetical protein RPR97_18135, partial [Colwellia sp.]
ANTQLFESYHEVSESNVELNSLKMSVLNEHMKSIDTRGRQVVEAENYCDLLNFDQSLVKAGLAHLAPKDTVMLKNIEAELFNKGLFNIAEIISLLRKKTESTGLVHHSLTSIKNSQNARTPKSEIEEEFYKELAQWIIQVYLDDKAGHKEKGLTPRNKKGSDTSADNLILEMAQREVILQRPPLGAESEKTDRQDGTLFGFPEIPESLKKIQLSKRFIQKTLKNIK